VDLVLLPGQTPLDKEKDALAGADGVVDCRRSQWNRTVRFAKSDHPVCLVSSRSFQTLVRFMCEHILATPLGNRLL
jgi:hypothetical protein